MRKFIIALVSFAAAFQMVMIPALPAAAQNLNDAGKYLGYTGISGNENPVTSSTGDTRLFSFIGKIINTVFGLLGIVFVVLMLFAGYKWMMAQGNSKEVDTAKDIIKAAIIGLIIMVLAYSITGFVMRSLSQATQG